MFAKFTVLAIVIFFSNMGLADRIDEIKELTKLKECVDSTNNALERFSVIDHAWLSHNESSLNLTKNFRFLTSQHKEFFDKVAQFQGRFLEPNQTIDEVAQQMKNIDVSHDEILESLSSKNEQDQIFIESLPSIEMGLEEVADELRFSKSHCDRELAIELDRYLDLIKQWLFEIGRMRSYIADAGLKRSELFSLILNATKLGLYQTYATRISATMSDTVNQVRDVLEIDGLYERLIKWWYKEVRLNGTARGMLSYYLQYDDSVVILTGDIEVAEQFLDELKLLPFLPQRVRVRVQNEVDIYKKFLVSALDKLVAGGWEGMLASQKEFADAIWQRRAEFSQGCQNTIERYRSSAADIKDKGAYKESEKLYYASKLACEKG